MENLIRDVIELDKKYRKQVEQLETEKDKISDFLRAQRTILDSQYRSAAATELDKAKKAMEEDLLHRKAEAEKDFNVTLKRLVDSFEANKSEWVETIFQFCIQE